jgi:Zn-dependent M28 family amino/carboxypeptidase
VSRRIRTSIGVAAATALIVAGMATPTGADNGTNTSALLAEITAAGVTQHMQAFQGIANANGGNRSAGTAGHVQSAQYVESKLQAAGYVTTRQNFSYTETIVDLAVMRQTSPAPIRDFVYGVDFFDMDYAAEGDVTALVHSVEINLAGDRASTSGCEAADFTGFVAGRIALIQRGGCSFRQKADNAQAAGAGAVIVFNQGNVDPTDDRFGLFGGTLSSPGVTIPVVSAPFQLGADLSAIPGLTLRIAFEAHDEIVNTFNVLADTGGRIDRTVVVGGHLDGVPEGPGINDNGSGTAAILETAIQMKRLGIVPTNRIRFAFWSGEEDGLIGSSYYVSQLSARDIKNHAANLNFDMIGSPNAVRFVYDGDGDAFGTTGPNGSGVVEDVFTDYFAAQGLASAPTEFDGRSDYFAFIENGIPAGGLFSGAEDLKTTAEALIYGGTAGAPYDPCYHAVCDTIANVDTVVLGQMADAIAHATLTLGMTTSAVNGTAKGKGTGTTNLEYKGNLALR